MPSFFLQYIMNILDPIIGHGFGHHKMHFQLCKILKKVMLESYIALPTELLTVLRT